MSTEQSVAATPPATETATATVTDTTSDERAPDERTPIVFFDGVCGLCNTTVDTLLRWDRNGALRFAPLQGETAAGIVSAEDRESLDSLVFLKNGRTYVRSAAVARILWQLGFGSRLLGTLLWLIPLPLRDLGYRLVSRYRYAWFGKKEACRMPTPAERARFLP